MKTIAVVCEKGGVGKSVLAHELYESYARQGLRTSFYSLDGQYSDAPRSKKVENAEVAVVDTAGVLTSDIKDIVSRVDVVVIPVRPTPNDVEPFTRTVRVVQKNTDVPIVIVVNGWNRFRMCTTFMQWLSTKTWATNVVTVPQSEVIVQAQAEGTSAVKIDRYGVLREQILKMCGPSVRLPGCRTRSRY